MIQGELFKDANYIFKVDYYKKGKPRGKRSNETHASTYSEVLYKFLLKELCEKVHGHDWWDLVLNDEDIICHRENNVSAYYSVVFKNGNKAICEYRVEMEVIALRKEIINDPKASPTLKMT